MSKQREIFAKTPRLSARDYVTMGVGGAAMVGVGLLLATPPAAPAPSATAPAVRLASTDSPLPLAPQDPWWLLDGDNSLVGSAGSPTTNALTAASTGLNILTPIGPGGWLIGERPRRPRRLRRVGLQRRHRRLRGVRPWDWDSHSR